MPQSQTCPEVTDNDCVRNDSNAQPLSLCDIIANIKLVSGLSDGANDTQKTTELLGSEILHAHSSIVYKLYCAMHSLDLIMEKMAADERKLFQKLDQSQTYTSRRVWPGGPRPNAALNATTIKHLQS